MGFARIAPAALAVGFITNLIVFPPSFAIVYFFRKAQPKQEKPSRVKEALDKTKRESELAVVGYSIFYKFRQRYLPSCC